MVTAYILVMSESGAERSVVQNLLELEFIRDAAIVYGEYDIIAKVRLKDVSELSNFIVSNIRGIPGVQRTSTLIVATND